MANIDDIKPEKRRLMKWVYQPEYSEKHWPFVRIGMLRRKQMDDGRTVRAECHSDILPEMFGTTNRVEEIGQ